MTISLTKQMTGRERLAHLITILENVQPETFKLDVWHCGTASCAVGHACLAPVFNEQGLTLRTSSNAGIRGWPSYRSEIDWGAVEKFFDLAPVDAWHLFSPREYPDAAQPQDVISRIKEYLG